MIDFSLAPELELVRETARGFAETHLAPEDRAAESARRVAPAARAAFREIGLAELELPERLGGAGLGALARTLVLEELAAADAGGALALDALGSAFYALAELGGDRALSELARPLLDRDGARAVLFCDPGSRIRQRAGRATGAVPWVPCDAPDLLVVLGADGAFAVDAGIACEPLRGAGLRAAGAAGLVLEDAPIRAAWEGRGGAARALARARLYVAAMLVGVMRASEEFARSYAQQRVAFGRPIAHHQALAFLITDMHGAVTGSRLLVQEAAWRLDAGRPAEEACATALLEASEQALFVTPNGVQILGGHGFMQDYPVEKWMREARALSLLLGSPDRPREDAGGELRAAGAPVALTLPEEAPA